VFYVSQVFYNINMYLFPLDEIMFKKELFCYLFYMGGVHTAVVHFLLTFMSLQMKQRYKNEI